MIEIIRNGGQICIVDSGRYHYRKYGVPLSGAMDIQSAARANSLLHNCMKDALLELTMPGHQLIFHTDTTISIAGAEGKMDINDQNIYTDHTYKIKKGSILSIGALRKGCRIYLAFPGGIQSAIILGSRSPIPGFLERRLGKGDRISILSDYIHHKSSSIIAPIKIIPTRSIRCFVGPEWKYLNKSERQKVLDEAFTIDNKSNRMGYRLTGAFINLERKNMYSSSVMPGTVQLLPNGLPLILMRDSQTTGGYPRILQVIEEDINQLAQRSPGNEVQFELINS